MKIYALLNKQDTDECCEASVDLFLSREAAQQAMREQFESSLPSWGFKDKTPDEMTDESHCEIGEDDAHIVDGLDSTHWRIEEKELDVQVAIHVSDDMVRSVHSNAGVGADVYDEYFMQHPEEGEPDRMPEFNELVNSPGWRQVW